MNIFNRRLLFKNTPDKVRRMMRSISSNKNKSTELKFNAALKEASILGWVSQTNVCGISADIYFPWYEIAIFLDGCFWHGCSKCGHIPKTNNWYWQDKINKNQERDKRHNEFLTNNGYLVIRYWEHDLKQDLSNCIAALGSAIEDRLLYICSNTSY